MSTQTGFLHFLKQLTNHLNNISIAILAGTNRLYLVGGKYI